MSVGPRSGLCLRVPCAVSTGHQATDLFRDRFVFVARKGHPAVCGRIALPPIVAATDYVAALSELVAHTLSLQILKMPLPVPSAWVRLIWNDRTTTSPAHAWLRRVVAEIGSG